MPSYKLINCILSPENQKEGFASLLDNAKQNAKKSSKLLITLFSRSDSKADYLSNNLSNAEDLKVASLLEYHLKNEGLSCQLIDGSKSPYLSLKNNSRRWQLMQLSFKRKLASKNISIVTFNKFESDDSSKLLFQKSTFPIRLAEFLKLKSCLMLLPKNFYNNSLKEIHIKNSGDSELSYSELIDVLSYSDEEYLKLDFIEEAKNKKVALYLSSFQNEILYEVKRNKEISGESVHLIKATVDMDRFMVTWKDRNNFQKTVIHLFNLLSQKNINTFGTQSTSISNGKHILSMFIEKKNADEANMLFEYNKQKIEYENISVENEIGIIDIIGQKFHSSSRIVSQITNIMVNRSYSFDIINLNVNHIRLSVGIDFIKKATRLLKDELM